MHTPIGLSMLSLIVLPSCTTSSDHQTALSTPEQAIDPRPHVLDLVS
jgi:hypothetical protein